MRPAELDTSRGTGYGFWQAIHGRIASEEWRAGLGQRMKGEGVKTPSLPVVQKLAWLYAALFLIVVAIGYIPGLTDAQGQLLGLFSIEPEDDALHLGSAIWAALAAWLSVRASTFYFKLFGSVYGLDGLVGLWFGQAFLDGGIFLHGIAPLSMMTKVMANLPHILIGGTAVYIGFVLGCRATPRA